MLKRLCITKTFSCHRRNSHVGQVLRLKFVRLNFIAIWLHVRHGISYGQTAGIHFEVFKCLWWSFGCTTTATKFIHLHARFGDTFYEHNTNCDWILIKQSDQRIHFTFLDIDNEKAYSFDFADLNEERNNRDCIMNGLYCGELIQLEIV